MLLRMVLADAGAVIVGEGADGLECIEGAAAADPSVVLLDLNMPGLGGLETLPKLRESLPGVKIVVLTTSKNAESERAAMAAGADARRPECLRLQADRRDERPAAGEREARGLARDVKGTVPLTSASAAAPR